MHSCVRTHKGEIKHENYIYINNCMMNIQNKHAGQEYIAPACRIILLKDASPCAEASAPAGKMLM